jgi:hypothetical protein
MLQWRAGALEVCPRPEPPWYQGFRYRPTEYRGRHGLPRDDPMMAPSNAAKRSELAKT